jgi:hypothetical protein
MNVFDTTKKCYKLACMDGVKTSSRTWKAMESNRFPHVFR